MQQHVFGGGEDAAAARVGFRAAVFGAAAVFAAAGAAAVAAVVAAVAWTTRPLAVVHGVEQVQALAVAAEDAGGHGEGRPAGHFAEMPEMRLHRVETVPRRHVVVVRSCEAQQGVGRVPEHLQVAALGHVAVEVEPVGRDPRGVQDERAGEVVRGGPRGAVGAGEERRLVAAQHGARPVAVEAQALHHRNQAVVAQPRQVPDGPAGRLGVGLGDDPGDQIVGELRPLEMGPRELEGRSELLQEVAHSCLTPGQPVGEKGSHDAPAKAGTVDDGLIDLVCSGGPVVDEVQGLPPHRLQEPVRDEGVDLGIQHERVHSDRTVDGRGPRLGLGGGLAPAHHLDQRHQVDGVEGMADAHPPRRRAIGLQAARQQAGGRGRDDHVLRGRPARLREQAALHVLALRRALLDEVGVRDRFRDVRGRGDPAGRDGGREGQAGVGAPRVFQRFRQPGRRARVRIVDAHVDAVHREPRRPSGPDDPRPEEGDAPDLALAPVSCSGPVHGCTSLPVFTTREGRTGPSPEGGTHHIGERGGSLPFRRVVRISEPRRPTGFVVRGAPSTPVSKERRLPPGKREAHARFGKRRLHPARPRPPRRGRGGRGRQGEARTACRYPDPAQAPRRRRLLRRRDSPCGAAGEPRRPPLPVSSTALRSSPFVALLKR